ncbi:MAG: hypothetical protein J0M11_22760 [Anaerolineae bacterium]|nr:hypothetical protein [Anaerolineae bacterium]
MPAQTEFPLVFKHLKAILTPYAKTMTVKQDTDNAFYLDASYSEKWKKELYFGSVHIKKNYVSFYFMPVYMHPDLLKDISPDLKKHMQGKSCFNFKTVEKSLFDELKTLVKQGHERFLRENYS